MSSETLGYLLKTWMNILLLNHVRKIGSGESNPDFLGEFLTLTGSY